MAERRESTSQKVILERKEIENLGVMTIGEVLGKLPGVEAGATGSDGSASQRALGMSRDSVQILVDGERPAGGSRMVAGVIDIPGELKAFTQAKTIMDAFWLYKLTPQFNLRLSGQNLLAADTVRETLFTSAGNTWQLHTVEGGYRSIMATVEGRW